MQRGSWVLIFCKIHNINRGLSKGKAKKATCPCLLGGWGWKQRPAKVESGAPLRAERPGRTIGSTSCLTSMLPTHKAGPGPPFFNKCFTRAPLLPGDSCRPHGLLTQSLQPFCSQSLPHTHPSATPYTCGLLDGSGLSSLWPSHMLFHLSGLSFSLCQLE